MREGETPEEFRARIQSIQAPRGGASPRRGVPRPGVQQGRDTQGQAWVAVTDELGNTVTRKGESQGVTIRPEAVKVSITPQE